MKRLALIPSTLIFVGCFSAEDLPMPPFAIKQSSEDSGNSGGETVPGRCRGMPVPYMPMCDDGNDADGDACTSDCKCGISNEKHFSKDSYGEMIIAYSATDGTNACYVLILREKNWFDAQIKCAQASLQLAVIETAEELNMLHENMALMEHEDSAQSIWIGAGRYNASSSTDNKHWRWLNGETLATDMDESLWGTDEPNNGGNEDCVEIRYKPDQIEIHGRLNDFTCDSLNNFLCRTPVPFTP